MKFLVFITTIIILEVIEVTPLKGVYFKEIVPCDEISVRSFNEHYVPDMEGSRKGDMGRILVIGGSEEYTGAPYFAAIAALKNGADLVSVLTTESAAPVIKSYSPDLIVYPSLFKSTQEQLKNILSKADVVVIGPGLGRDAVILNRFEEILHLLRVMMKPLVIDADGLYAVSKKKEVLKDYPGAILTPNYKEAKYLQESVGEAGYKYFGSRVSVLVKGHIDKFYAEGFNWTSSEAGSSRRAAGQGDILAGTIGTFYSWTKRNDKCNPSMRLAQSIAAFAAARKVRICNAQAYDKYGRSMVASDMIQFIHTAK